MHLQPLDTTLALKAITLASGFSGTEKQVAGVIIDSFNRKTGQCDPSLGRIARLLKISRRAVIRAVNSLVAAQFVRKVRHGGKSHRNSYEPNWALFREIDAKWNVIFYAKGVPTAPVALAHSGCQLRHPAGVESVTQTFLTNHSKEPVEIGRASQAIDEKQKPIGPKDNSEQAVDLVTPTLCAVTRNRSLEAARASAERRWSRELNFQYSATPEIYGKIIDAIDLRIQSAATEAEMTRHGGGLAYILNQLMTEKYRESSEG